MKQSELRKIIKEEIKAILGESTRARVGIKSTSGKIKSIYVHYDGGLSNVGADLKKYYKNIDKVKQLLNLGNLSSIGKEIGEKQDFKNPHDGWTVAYARDRGERKQPAKISNDVDTFIKDTDYTSGEFAYYYDLTDKSWYYAKLSGGVNTAFKKL